MKIALSPYQLTFKHSGSIREGTLIRITWDDSFIGYCDCHPWPELGDFSLKRQLQLLKQGILTPLTKQSLDFARKDAEARKKEISLTDGNIPQSHFLWLDFNQPETLYQATESGFTHFKIKLPKKNQKVKETLVQFCQSNPKCKIRIDLNLKWTEQEFTDLLADFAEIIPSIDFFEDPFPYNQKRWKSYAFPFARDAHSEEEGEAEFHVVKPARQKATGWDHAKSLVVTSYLDHPLGQVQSATVAAIIPVGVCGLLSHLVYQPNPFSERLKNQGPNLILDPNGTGYGFDDLLHKQTWREYCELDLLG